MQPARRLTLAVLALGAATLLHALWTWPPIAVLALFAGGATLAFVAEAAAIRLGWLTHALRPQAAGVPLVVLLAWPATTYLFLRVALLAATGTAAVLLAAALATAYDVLTDHHGVEDGLWTYTDDLPGPRHRGVPWWNYAGWYVLVAATSALTVAVSPTG